MLDFLSLPEEVILHITSFLSKKDVLTLIEVCKSLRDLISNSGKALENVQIEMNRTRKEKSFNLLLRKYSSLKLIIDTYIDVDENMKMLSIIHSQLRILHIDGWNLKLSSIAKILSCCSYLKEFSLKDENELEVDDVEVDDEILPAIRIDTVIVFDQLKVLDVFKMCRIKYLIVYFKPEYKHDDEYYDDFIDESLKHFELFLNHHKNLLKIEIKNLSPLLTPDILPESVKVLKIDSSCELLNFYDFTKIVQCRNLEKLKIVIEFDPKFLNQLAGLESLTHLNLKLIYGYVKIFADLKVMEHVQCLTINENFVEQICFNGKFPNLKYLKIKNNNQVSFKKFFYNMINLFVENFDIDIKIPFGLDDIRIKKMEFFIQRQKLESCKIDRSSIEKVRYWEKQIELKATVKMNNEIINMKILLTKAENLNLNSINRSSTLDTIDDNLFIKIISHLNYWKILKLRFVCKRFNEIVSKSESFQSRTLFDVNQESYETLLKGKYPNIALREFSTFPLFDWCLDALRNVGQNVRKIVLHINSTTSLMMLHNVIKLCENITEIEIYENSAQILLMDHSVLLFYFLSLKLDLLKIRGNLSILNIFRNSEIKLLSVIDPRNSLELFNFYKASKIEKFEIVNGDIMENYQIMNFLDETLGFSFSPKNFEVGIDSTVIIRFLNLDCSSRGCINKLKLENVHNMSIFDAVYYIDELCMMNSSIDINQTFPCVRTLNLKDCKIVTEQEENLQMLNDVESKVIAGIFVNLNSKLQKVEIENVLVPKYWVQKLKN